MEKVPKVSFSPGQQVELVQENTNLINHAEFLGYSRDAKFVIRHISGDEMFLYAINTSPFDKEGFSLTKEPDEDFSEYVTHVSLGVIRKTLQ